jgi:DNA-binding response OmpR family regulator
MVNSKTVIVIDDEEAIRKLYKMLLSRKGYDVETAENGDIGIEMIKSKKYEVAIVDFIMVCKLFGVDLIRKIKELSPETKIISISGFTNKVLPETILENGANSILTKPIPINDLVNEVETIM